MKPPLARISFLFCFSFGLATNGWSATYDPAADFEKGFLSNSNPNGVWSYGSSASSTAPVTLFTGTTQTSGYGPNAQAWYPSGSPYNTPWLWYNNGPASNAGGVDVLANEIVLQPVSGQNSNLVFTAPAAGTYSVVGRFRGDQSGIGVVAGVVANGSLLMSSGITADGQTVPFSYTVDLSAGSTVVFSVALAGGTYNTGLLVAITGPLVSQVPYYFSHLAVGNGYQTTLTYINYSPQPITCVTNFYSDIGSPLSVPFSGGAVSTRTDTLAPGQSIHDQTNSNSTALTPGWAQATCTGSVQASLLYRLYQNGVPVGEAGVNAETGPTTAFATFAQTATGVAFANPSTTQSASVTLTVYDATGTRLGGQTISLGPLAHGAYNLGPLLGIASFSGFVKITSTLPIVSLSLNAEAFPVFSSLPPGDLPGSSLLVTP
jgi:hypothetical protein